MDGRGWISDEDEWIVINIEKIILSSSEVRTVEEILNDPNPKLFDPDTVVTAREPFDVDEFVRIIYEGRGRHVGEIIGSIVLDSNVVSYVFNRSTPSPVTMWNDCGTLDSSYRSRRLRRPGTERIAAAGAQAGDRTSQAISNDMKLFGLTLTWWEHAPVCALNGGRPGVS